MNDTAQNDLRNPFNEKPEAEPHPFPGMEKEQNLGNELFLAMSQCPGPDTWKSHILSVAARHAFPDECDKILMTKPILAMVCSGDNGVMRELIPDSDKRAAFPEAVNGMWLRWQDMCEQSPDVQKLFNAFRNCEFI